MVFRQHTQHSGYQALDLARFPPEVQKIIVIEVLHNPSPSIVFPRDKQHRRIAGSPNSRLSLLFPKSAVIHSNYAPLQVQVSYLLEISNTDV